MKERLSAPRVRSEAPRLWTATFVLLGLRYSEAVAARLLEGVSAMEESVTYQAILRKGRTQEAQAMLLRVGSEKLGEPDEQSRAAVEAIQDTERLEGLAVRVLRSSSWEELLAQPTPAPRPRRRKPKA
jgi:hypothetical protein